MSESYLSAAPSPKEKAQFRAFLKKWNKEWKVLVRDESLAAKAPNAEEFFRQLSPVGKRWGREIKIMGSELLTQKWPSANKEVADLGTKLISLGSWTQMVMEAKSYSDYKQRMATLVGEWDREDVEAQIAVVKTRLGL